jgi:anti-sigma regulatory factor (Ser/Thr protein kinase)
MEAVPAAVPTLRGAIADFLDSVGIGDPLLTSAKLAVSEAVTNAVMHAYVDAPRPGAVSVDATFEGDALLVEVADEGSGMMPRLDSPGLGVGLPLIADTTDTLDIANSPRGGTVLRMSFRLEHCSAR